MSETHRIFRIKRIKPIPSHAVTLLILCGDRLTAAADTAAGTSHDLYKIILHLALLQPFNQLTRIAQTTDNRTAHRNSRNGIGCPLSPGPVRTSLKASGFGFSPVSTYAAVRRAASITPPVAPKITPAPVCVPIGNQCFLLDEMRVQMVCTHHTHQFPCCLYDIHIRTAFTTHGRQICFAFFATQGMMETQQIFRVPHQASSPAMFSQPRRTSAGRFCRRKLICQFRILPFQETHPTGTAACEHGPTHQCAAFQPMQKFIAFLHNRQVCRKVCIIYIIESRRCSAAMRSMVASSRFQPKILPKRYAPQRNLYDRNFFFICQSRSCLCGVISFSLSRLSGNA